MKSVCQEDYTVMQQIFVDICQHTYWRTLKRSIGFFIQSEKRKATSELVFTRSKDIDFRLIK